MFPEDMSFLEANLTLFYAKHNPDKLQHVNHFRRFLFILGSIDINVEIIYIKVKLLLQVYKGREIEMVQILERKYNAWFPQL